MASFGSRIHLGGRNIFLFVYVQAVIENCWNFVPGSKAKQSKAGGKCGHQTVATVQFNIQKTFKGSMEIFPFAFSNYSDPIFDFDFIFSFLNQTNESSIFNFFS